MYPRLVMIAIMQPAMTFRFKSEIENSFNLLPLTKELLCCVVNFKAADLQNKLENHKLYKYFKISLQIHILVFRNQTNG